MIVCHCTNITDHEIHAAVDWMRASDPAVLITPGKIYHALGKAADCGGCVPLFLDTMRKNANLPVPAQLQNLRKQQCEETPIERRSTGH
ncbi:(2Fe-2S)-binding protein [Shimia marina]|uniref:BFD-like [2Fe-2S] binding domain protein n=1 Tax=Shimia marina TaxID=321267 RepID=A0A0P1EPB8_9RHOB|nr:(2Fe-2S)-binding protein [Shimia marina]CUH52142.1 BFD-like [2Fe-2S] binding domain protein [Shimia marina]SFE64817.1 Bacterioferritin-associated ferredoxin [Shimia marina]